MRSRTRVALLLLALVCVAGVSAAHETWILPTSMRVRVGQPVALTVTSGTHFPNEESVVAPARIDRSEVRLGDEIYPLPRPQVTPRALHYLWTPTVPGVATIAVETAPRSLELKAAQIKEYFDEIHATPAIIAQ